MRISYRPDIDGLRAIAVWAVVGFHAFPEVFPGGFIGVDVFFVISGFLITSILVNEHQAGVWRLSGFYARRILRIFPALLLVLYACLWAGWHVLLADEYKQLGKHIAAGAGFVANFSLWFESGYFDRSADFKPLLHLWSLGIEEQFYIVWPLLLWALWRAHAKLKNALLILGVLSFVVACGLVWSEPTQAFYAPWSRMWELMLGAGLSVGQTMRPTQPLPDTRRIQIQWVSMGLLVVGIFTLTAQTPFPGLAALIPTLGAFGLIAVGATRRTPTLMDRCLTAKTVVWMGLISYPLYLWHWPLLSFFRIVNSGEISIFHRLGLIGLAVLLAALTYVLIEKPIRKISRRLSISLLLILMVLVAMLGWNVFHRDGLERIRHKRMIEVGETWQQDFLDFEKTGLITDRTCESPFLFPEKQVCLQTHLDQPVTAVVMGDSHAVHAYWGLRLAFEQAGQNLTVWGKGACVPLLGYPKSGDFFKCQPHVDQTLKAIAENKDIRFVAMVFRGKYLGFKPSDQALSDFSIALDQTMNLLTRSGKTIHYFLPIAEPGFDPRLCAGSLPFGRKPPHPCTIDLAQDRVQSQALVDAARSVLRRYPQVQIMDPNDAICQNGECPILQQSHSIFKDDNHLSFFGSNLIGQQLQLKAHSH